MGEQFFLPPEHVGLSGLWPQAPRTPFAGAQSLGSWTASAGIPIPLPTSPGGSPHLSGTQFPLL